MDYIGIWFTDSFAFVKKVENNVATAFVFLIKFFIIYLGLVIMCTKL